MRYFESTLYSININNVGLTKEAGFEFFSNIFKNVKNVFQNNAEKTQQFFSDKFRNFQGRFNNFWLNLKNKNKIVKDMTSSAVSKDNLGNVTQSFSQRSPGNVTKITGEINPSNIPKDTLGQVIERPLSENVTKITSEAKSLAEPLNKVTKEDVRQRIFKKFRGYENKIKELEAERKSLQNKLIGTGIGGLGLGVGGYMLGKNN